MQTWSFWIIVRKRLLLLTAVCLGYLMLGLWGASRLHIESDLNYLLPPGSINALEKTILNQHPLNRRIVFFVRSLPGTSADLNTMASLSEEAFYASELPFWQRLELRQNPAEMDSLRRHVIRMLPWILTPEEIRAEAAALRDTAVLRQRMERVFQMLLSPGARFVQDALLSDPLGLSARWFARLDQLNGSRYHFTPDGLMTDSTENLLLGWLAVSPQALDSMGSDALVKTVARVTQSLKSHNIEIGFYGAPLVAAENARVIRHDVEWTLFFALLTIALLLGASFRTWKFLPVLFITLGGGALGAILTAVLAMPHIPALSLGLAAVFVGISVDYALHLLTHRAQGLDSVEILKRVYRPMLLSMLTTVASFSVLTFTKSPVTKAFGWLAAGGIVGSCITALFVAPQFFPVLVHSGKFPSRWSHYLKHFHLPGLIVFVAVNVLAVAFFKDPPLDADPENLSYVSTEQEAAADVLESTEGARRKNILLVMEEGNEDLIFQETQKIDAFLKLNPHWHKHTEFLTPTVLFPPPSVRKESAEIWDSVFSPAKRKAICGQLDRLAAAKGFRSGLFEGFAQESEALSQPAPDLNQLIALLPEGLRELFVFFDGDRMIHTGVLRVEANFHDEVLDKLGAQQLNIKIFDKKQLAATFFSFLRKDFESVVGWSVLLVGVVLLVGFGRVELAAAGFLPLLLAWLWLGALMTFSGLSFNVVSLIVCSFVFGLGVDYSVFYLYRQIHSYAYGEKSDPAIAAAVRLSALTTLLATGGLILSRHPALYSIGLLSIAGIGGVWLNAAVLSPVFFRWLTVKPASKGLKPHTLKNLIATILVWTGLVLPFIGAILLAPVIFILCIGKKKRIQNFFRHYIWLWAKIYTGLVFWCRRRYVCFNKVDFNRPMLVYANHQSLIDTALIFSLSPRLVVGTKNSIYNHPLFGPISRLCGFVNVSEGHEKYKLRVLELLKEGYSFALFPEGTRSEDFKIHRFHSGLFDLALSSGCPLLPVVFVGTGHLLHKGAFWGSRQHLIMEVGPPQSVEQDSTEGAARKLASLHKSYLQKRYAELLKNYGGGSVAADHVRHRFLYISPELEWYMRIKLQMEGYYESIHRHIPIHAEITELGCGMGLIGHMLTCDFPERAYTGYDLDESKIRLARSRLSPYQNKVRFMQADIITLKPYPCEVLIVSDVLHYLPQDTQWPLMDGWAEALRPGGLLIFREGLADDLQKHFLTRLSEYLSIRVMRFNKSLVPIRFPSRTEVETFLARHGLEVLEFRTQRFSSNCLWILRKPQAIRSTTLPV